MPVVPKEVVLEQYQLRSTFFFEKLEDFGFFGFAKKISKIIEDQGSTYDWACRDSWGISNDAWEVVASDSLDPLLVFCHPRIIRQHPKLLRYYRSISLLPQKGFQKIACVSSLKNIEAGDSAIPEQKVIGTVTAVNELMSSVVSLSSGISREKINGMMYATAGTTIDGSWRNKIGSEGERVIRSILVRSLLSHQEILAITDKNDTSRTVSEWREEVGMPVATITQMKSVVVRNGSTLLFSSEPDVTFLDSAGTVVGAMEIKAGIDPAAALERLGAMFKSFDNVLSVTPDATTILVATCITDEVASRLQESNAVSKTYLTTDVINNKAGKGQKMANAVRSILGLIEKGM